jgi:DEAD/DEAH box helicase
VVHPAGLDLRSDAPPRLMVTSRLPLTWRSWRMTQLDLRGVSWLELEIEETPTRRRYWVRSRLKPRLAAGPPVPGVTTATAAPVHCELPVVLLPAGTGRWRIEARRAGGTVLAAITTTAAGWRPDQLWQQVSRPVLGTVTVTVAPADRSAGPRLRRTVTVAEGLGVAYSPAPRLTSERGLEPAEAVLTAPPGMTVVPQAGLVPAESVTIKVTCLAGPVVLPIRVTPPHLRMRIEPEPGSGGKPTAWHHLGPLAISGSDLRRGGALRLDLPGLAWDPPLEVIAREQTVQVLQPTRQGRYPLRRMLDTVNSHREVSLRITVGGRTAIVAHAAGTAAHADPWLAAGTNVLWRKTLGGSSAVDVIATSALLSATYRRYLRSLLPVRDPALAAALAERIAGSPLLTKGPILEATPPYRTGASLREMIAGGVLHPAFARLGGPTLPLDRPLYLHQEQAIRKAAAGRNLVVASGTGSGKTECFLLPVLSALTAEHAAGTLGPGVRALLLYPMNALANDQVRRLRQLLAGSPQITFGRYTGDTPERKREGASLFEELNPGEPRLPGELLSREEMRDNPPHLLLTNYAMLEYLLLRPADLDLFEGKHGGHWRFVILDEAHVYDGAKAEEVGMLLRRLRERVGRAAAGARTGFQAIATSATVGDRPRAVVSFASKLFDVPFEWRDEDPSRQDLVSAQREDMPAGPFWGPLTAADYLRLAGENGDPASELPALAADLLPLRAGADAAAALSREAAMAKLRGLLARTPVPFAGLAREVFPGEPEQVAESALAAMVALGARIHDPAGTPVLSARYHLFARATEGAFTCLTPAGPHVSLARHEVCPDCQGAVFEFGCCKRCGAVHLAGTIDRDTAGERFTSRVTRGDRRAWLLLGEAQQTADEDDETLEDADAATATDSMLCGRCGALHAGAPANSTTSCGCAAENLRPVHRLAPRSGAPRGCLACGARGGGMIRLFESGNEASAAVLATALYQALPPAEDLADRPGGGRKLLAFSDSRQAAAFFAPYLEASHSVVQQRRLILDGLARATARDATCTVDDLIEETAAAASHAGVFGRRESRQGRRREAARWVMRELVALDERQSLEGLGLLRAALDRDPSWAPPRPLLDLGLTGEECWLLLAELLRTLRLQGALTMPEEVDPADEMFDPRRGPIYVRGDGAEARLKVLSWLPTRGINKRLDYLRRLLAALDGRPAEGAAPEPREVLAGCWRALTVLRDGWLRSAALPRIGQVHQVDHAWLTLAPATGAAGAGRTMAARPDPTSTPFAASRAPARCAGGRWRTATRPTSCGCGWTPPGSTLRRSGAPSCTRCWKARPRAWRSAAVTSAESCTPAPTAAAAWCFSTPSPAGRAACCGSRAPWRRPWRRRCAASARATAAWRPPATAACARRATNATTRT